MYLVTREVLTEIVTKPFFCRDVLIVPQFRLYYSLSCTMACRCSKSITLTYSIASMCDTNQTKSEKLLIHQEIIWFYGILNSSRYSYFWFNHFPVTTGCHDDSFKGNEARVVSIGFRQFTYSSNDLSSSKCSSTFLKVPVAP